MPAELCVIAARAILDAVSDSVQNSAELHCAPAPVHSNAPIRFLVELHIHNDWSLCKLLPSLGCYDMMLCLKLNSSYQETSHRASEPQLEI